MSDLVQSGQNRQKDPSIGDKYAIKLPKFDQPNYVNLFLAKLVRATDGQLSKEMAEDFSNTYELKWTSPDLVAKRREITERPEFRDKYSSLEDRLAAIAKALESVDPQAASVVTRMKNAHLRVVQFREPDKEISIDNLEALFPDRNILARREASFSREAQALHRKLLQLGYHVSSRTILSVDEYGEPVDPDVFGVTHEELISPVIGRYSAIQLGSKVRGVVVDTEAVSSAGLATAAKTAFVNLKRMDDYSKIFRDKEDYVRAIASNELSSISLSFKGLSFGAAHQIPIRVSQVPDSLSENTRKALQDVIIGNTNDLREIITEAVTARIAPDLIAYRNAAELFIHTVSGRRNRGYETLHGITFPLIREVDGRELKSNQLHKSVEKLINSSEIKKLEQIQELSMRWNKLSSSTLPNPFRPISEEEQKKNEGNLRSGRRTQETGKGIKRPKIKNSFSRCT